MWKITLLIVGVMMFVMSQGSAQVHLNFNINIDRQPIWGPVGYDHVEYYYLPGIEAYYYVPQHEFIYRERGHWRTAASLPGRYRNYDLYHSYKSRD